MPLAALRGCRDPRLSSVTRGAADLGLDVVGLDELCSERILVGGRLPRHVEDLVFWSDVMGRILVTIQAEAHLKCLRLVSERHLIHGPMAGGAAKALLNMDAVVEIDKVRHVVDAIPSDGLTTHETLADWFECRALCPDL